GGHTRTVLVVRYRMVDHAALRRHTTHEREVALLERRRLQAPDGFRIEREQEHTAGAAIESMHRMNRLFCDLARDRERDRAILGPSTVNQHSRRLVEHQQMLVAIQQHRRYCCRMSDGKQRGGESADKSAKERGIDAENRDFRRYEQVDKQQRYRLAESADP